MVEPAGTAPCFSFHRALGGGSVADVLLWRRKCESVVVLISATSLWFLFERVGHNVLSFVANVLLLLVVTLFLWAKSASLLNRPLPPVPNLEISEETVAKAAEAIYLSVNRALSVAHDIAIGRNLKVFFPLASGLWITSCIGSLCNLLTLIYIGLLFSFSIPILYDKYHNHIDGKLCGGALGVIRTQFHKIDRSPPSSKDKNT